MKDSTNVSDWWKDNFKPPAPPRGAHLKLVTGIIIDHIDSFFKLALRLIFFELVEFPNFLSKICIFSWKIDIFYLILCDWPSLFGRMTPFWRKIEPLTKKT